MLINRDRQIKNYNNKSDLMVSNAVKKMYKNIIEKI
jgi:hypothetical protein